MEATLLIELLTEELPPKSLRRLSEVFRDALATDLKQDGFLTDQSAARAFATPRRLGVAITAVRAVAPDQKVSVRGPSVKVGLDASGKPTQALLKFAEKRGTQVEHLVREQDGRQEVFVHRDLAKGGHLDANLALKVAAAIKQLPILTLMRWGDADAEFVRPVHGLVMMHGERVVAGSVLGLESRNRTRGHRFMGKRDQDIAIASADAYETQLRDEGMVIADFAARRAAIDELLNEEAARQGAVLGSYEDLLDEVTALVEHPSVYAGEFDRRFLDVPPECLILTMRQNQKYFPLFDAAGKLIPCFLIVSNIRVTDPRHIVGGNQRVVRPRLEDARFFYNRDRKVRLESRVPQLAKVVYHNKLGSQLERVERIQLLAGVIARKLDADALLAERAAWLAKADLLTGMVGEFPELQGIMGRYYALADGEDSRVADAIEQHYRPRFAGDALPENAVALAVALADKFEALAGLFSIGQQPTGDKDPFALRRSALGAIRILVEGRLPISLFDLVDAAFSVFPPGPPVKVRTDLETFIFDRFAGYLKDRGYSTLEVDSVLGLRPARIDLTPRKLEAVRAFLKLPEAESLAAANKRIRNILQKSPPPSAGLFSETKLIEKEERQLYHAFVQVDQQADRHLERDKFTDALNALAALRHPVDAFFDHVMVNVDDADLRNNRLLLLMQLEGAMNRVADISKLAA